MVAIDEPARDGFAARVQRQASLSEGESAVDVLAIGERVVSLRAKRIALGPAHGTGCTFASLVAGHLARAPRPSGDAALLAALRWAKRAHHAALEELRDVGGKARVVVFR